MSFALEQQLLEEKRPLRVATSELAPRRSTLPPLPIPDEWRDSAAPIVPWFYGDGYVDDDEPISPIPHSRGALPSPPKPQPPPHSLDAPMPLPPLTSQVIELKDDDNDGCHHCTKCGGCSHPVTEEELQSELIRKALEAAERDAEAQRLAASLKSYRVGAELLMNLSMSSIESMNISSSSSLGNDDDDNDTSVMDEDDYDDYFV